MDNENIQQLNTTISDQYKRLKITEAKFINGKIVFNLLKKDFCLVYDTATQSFENKQSYLHPD